MFFALGCVLGVAAIAALAWRPDPFGEFVDPGTDGLMTLLGVASAGWALVCVSFGYYLLRSGVDTSRLRWPIIAATVLGVLAGLAWYFIVEARTEGRRPAVGTGFDGTVHLQIPAFGLVLERDEGQAIVWTDSGSRRHHTKPNGVQAKFYLWLAAINIG